MTIKVGVPSVRAALRNVSKTLTCRKTTANHKLILNEVLTSQLAFDV